MPKRGNEDFAKVKHKVGKKKIDTKSTNVSVRTKRIRVQEQSIMKQESDLVNYRNKSLADLVGQFSHFSPTVRKEALFGLRDLFSQNESLYTTSANILITNSIKLLLDTDSGVRQALITVYSSLLPKIPSSQLCLFSDIVCVFVNNGLTSMSPAIRRSSLLMVQTLLSVEPALFRNVAVKLLVSMTKLASETRTSLVPSRGVLSSSRSQLNVSSKEHRSVAELALETVQLLFDRCLSTSTLYSEIASWSGVCDTSESTTCLHFSLHLSVYRPSLFFHASDSSSSSEPSLVAAVQSLLTALYSAVSEIVPEEEPAQHSLLHRLNGAKLRSKSVSEQSLRRLLLLEELAGNSLLTLRHAGIAALEGKSFEDWRSLLLDLYPLRLPDSHRNEMPARLLLQQVNELTVLLLVMVSRSDDEVVNDLATQLARQGLVLVAGGRDGGEARFETVQLRVELLHQLYERFENKEKVVEDAEKVWRQLVERKFAQYSLPFVQLFRFIVNCHDLVRFDACLESMLQVLSVVRYSTEEQSTGFKIWSNGLKLLLEVVKLSESTPDSFREVFQQQVAEETLVSSLSIGLQAIVRAVAFYCGQVEIQESVSTKQLAS